MAESFEQHTFAFEGYGAIAIPDLDIQLLGITGYSDYVREEGGEEVDIGKLANVSSRGSKKCGGSLKVRAITPKFLAFLAGGVLSDASATNKGISWVTDKNLEIEDVGKTATLTQEAIAGTLYVRGKNTKVRFKEVAESPEIGEYSLATTVLTFNATETETLLEIVEYFFYIEANATLLNIDLSTYSKAYDMLISGTWKDIEAGAVRNGTIKLFKPEFQLGPDAISIVQKSVMEEVEIPFTVTDPDGIMITYPLA